MATAPCPFFSDPPYAYPSSAAYPPTASGFSTAPVYPIPSAFPCAATHAYPPPASACTPAFGFSPNWPIWPPPAPSPTSSYPAYGSSTFPYAATYHHPFPSAFPSSVPNHINPNLPPPAPTRIHGDLHTLHGHHFSPTTDHHPVQGTPQPTAMPTAPAREDQPPQHHVSTPDVDSAIFSQSSPTGMPTPCHTPSDPTPHSLEEDAAVLAVTDERAQVKDATRRRQHREIISLQARLDKQIERDRSHRTSLDKLHGELSKLSTLVSQFAVAMGMETTEAPVTGSSPASAQFRSPATTALMFSGTGAVASSLVSSLSSPSDASTTAVVIPQMPDEMPQCYGLDNLNRQSLFLADGTERSYYALPENYPLERASPEPVFDICDVQMDGCSHEFVDVFVATPEQPCEEEQQESGQLLTCISKATITEQTSPCLNYNSDVFDYTLEKHLQKDEKASVNVQQLRDPQWNVLVIHERRKEWDPGDTELQVLFSNVSATKLQCTDVYKSKMVQLLVMKLGSSKAPIFGSAIMCSYTLGLGWTEVNTSANIQQLRAPALNILLLHERRKEWDPGDDCFGQPVDLKQFWDQLLVSSHSWYNTPNAFLQVHYHCLPFLLDCPYSEPVQLPVCYSSVFSLIETILSAMRMSTATTERMILVLSSGEIAQEERDAAAVYRNFKIQLPRSRTSHICDPGVQLSLYCWLDICTEWREIIKLLSCTNIPELATWQRQVTSASFVWDPGTMLLWYWSIWSLLFTEEMEMGKLIPEKWSLRFNAMHYCQIFQKCNAISSQFYWRDITFKGIDLWMIHFLPP